ncbi:uncharacterized protein B0I36DRAFT_365749 [Microdochium trichocladiopsis]|uniref:Putative transcription factor kapC n=1 Tax=Microdochium trichocladiopsis TaxID=1682393 RepID=A0A9P9BMR1_9PEZI|nr:uncharacterized protein B0I36DRAFT_365749 [Microdochium trichocladiopsis]KAH7026141.1 hypothetical protein B0I36DRAFT_365749 [Microdochium trichocladiopsis]
MDNSRNNSTSHLAPSLPFSYMYGEAEHYHDSPSTSSSTSPVDSGYDIQYSGYYASENFNPSADTASAENQENAPKAKRKRENRYKNAPPSVLSRRRAQNRASQRAYRERKDQRIKDLEVLLNEAQQKNDVLSQAYANLQAEYVKLKSDQDTTLQYQHEPLAYDPSVSQPNAAMNLYMFSDTVEYAHGAAPDGWS